MTDLIWIAGGLALAVLLVFAIACLTLFAAGPTRVWRRLAGPPDLGPVDFENLTRRRTPNDALAASPEAMGANTARIDVSLPVFSDEPSAVMTRLDAIVLAGGDIARLDDRERTGYRRYLARSPRLRFPDTIDAEAIAVAGGTGLRLYARAQLGRSDLGANTKRLEGWNQALKDAAAAEG